MLKPPQMLFYKMEDKARQEKEIF